MNNTYNYVIYIFIFEVYFNYNKININTNKYDSLYLLRGFIL